MRALVTLILVCALAPSAFAAVIPTETIRIVLTATPSYPRPGEVVSMKATAAVPVGVYTYQWDVDGDVLGEATDLNRISVSSAAAGLEKVVSVTLIDPSGRERGRAQYVLVSASVDLLWEGGTHTPPGYPGRPYPNGDSTIRLEAIPQLGDGAPDKAALVYEWYVDDKKIPAISGVGRYSAVIPAERYRYSTTVSVLVSTSDRAVAAKREVSIPHASPRIVVYEERPLVGTWYTGAMRGSAPFRGEEMTVRAVPFFFENPSLISFSWLLNGSAIDLTSNTDTITLRRNTASEATYRVSVRGEKKGSIFEVAGTVFTILLN